MEMAMEGLRAEVAALRLQIEAMNGKAGNDKGANGTFGGGGLTGDTGKDKAGNGKSDANTLGRDASAGENGKATYDKSDRGTFGGGLAGDTGKGPSSGKDNEVMANVAVADAVLAEPEEGERDAEESD